MTMGLMTEYTRKTNVLLKKFRAVNGLEKPTGLFPFWVIFDVTSFHHCLINSKLFHKYIHFPQGLALQNCKVTLYPQIPQNPLEYVKGLIQP